jgi:hypothetical protein
MPTQDDDDLRSEASEPPYQSDAAEHFCPPPLISQPQTGSLIPVCSERHNPCGISSSRSSGAVPVIFPSL